MGVRAGSGIICEGGFMYVGERWYVGAFIWLRASMHRLLEAQGHLLSVDLHYIRSTTRRGPHTRLAIVVA